MQEAVGQIVFYHMILFRDMSHMSSIELSQTYLSEQCVVLFYGAMRTLSHNQFYKTFCLIPLDVSELFDLTFSS